MLNYLTDFTSQNRWTAEYLKTQFGHIRTPDRIVLHTTEGLWPEDAKYLCEPNPANGQPVSCHYIIDPTGGVHELVSPDDAAWGCYTTPSRRTERPDLWVTAGWGDFNQNWNALNIEVSAAYRQPMNGTQLGALAALVAALIERYHIRFDRSHIVGHYELSTVKIDPPGFDWDLFWNLARVALGAAPLAPPPPALYFQETGHHLQGGFLAFWQTRGGGALFGLPLSEEVQEGKLTVQYFENVRFEYNPQSQPGHMVRLGPLGRMYLQAKGAK